MSSTDQQGSKTPGQMLKIGSSVVIVPIVVLIFLIKMNLGSGGTDRDSMAPEMVLSRIAPVALYNTGAPLPEPKDAVPLTGEQVYNRLCMTCHDAGVTDAPIKGNADQWAPRIAQGADVLFKHSLEGFNAMPAKGGDASLSDEEVKNAVVFMVNASGGDISIDGSGGDAAAPTEEAPAEVEATEEAVAEVTETAEVVTEAITEEVAEITEQVTDAKEEATEAIEEVAPTEVNPAETDVEVPEIEEAVTEDAAESTEVIEEDAAESTEAIEEEAAIEELEAPVKSEETPAEQVAPEVEQAVEAEDIPLNQQVPAQESI